MGQMTSDLVRERKCVDPLVEPGPLRGILLTRYTLVKVESWDVSPKLVLDPKPESLKPLGGTPPKLD